MNKFYLDNNLYCGRPEDIRQNREMRCYDLLDSLSIAYQRAEHAPANTIDDCKEVEKVIGVGISKNLFLCNRQKTRFYLLLMPGEKPFKTSIFSKLIGSSRLSFAGEEHMLELLDLHPGSVSILGLLMDTDKRVQLVIDSDIVKCDYMRCHPCANTTTLKLLTSDVLEKLLPAMDHEPIILDIPWQTDN